MSEVIECRLTEIGEIKFVTSGWTDLPEGGQVPIRTPVDPYFRYYCACGAVGGKSHDAQSALVAYLQHKDRKASHAT